MTVKITDRFVIGIIPDAGQRKRGFSAECGHCGVRGSVAMTGRLPQEKENKIVVSKFEARGWKMGNQKAQHRCPGCYSAIKATSARKSQERKTAESPEQAKDYLKLKEWSGKVVKMQTPPIVEIAKEMSREDRRIVFEKLNEVYADEKIGYSADWTDSKVANDLGVPRSWVASVRDEMFGPEGSNANIRSTVREAKELLMEIKKAAEPAEKIMADLRMLINKADKIEKTVIEIQRAVS